MEGVRVRAGTPGPTTSSWPSGANVPQRFHLCCGRGRAPGSQGEDLERAGTSLPPTQRRCGPRTPRRPFLGALRVSRGHCCPLVPGGRLVTENRGMTPGCSGKREYDPDLPSSGTQMRGSADQAWDRGGRAGAGGPKACPIGGVVSTNQAVPKERRYRDSRSLPTHSKGTKLSAGVNAQGPRVLPRWGGEHGSAEASL